MEVLVHPVYLPNISLFAVLSQRKVRLEINDNYQKQTYRNRTYICTDQGRFMLSIPIIHQGKREGRQLYKDVLLENDSRWQRRHWRTLQTAYRTSPFFEYYEDDIMPLYTTKFRYLLDFNLRSIEILASCLQLDLSCSKTESYDLQPQQMTDARDLVNAKKTIPIEQQNYIQVFNSKHGFVPNCSTIDLLFNKGPEALNYLQAIKLNYLND